MGSLSSLRLNAFLITIGGDYGQHAGRPGRVKVSYKSCPFIVPCSINQSEVVTYLTSEKTTSGKKQDTDQYNYFF